MMKTTILTLLAGVAIGVLLAPDKGSETLKKLRNRVKDLEDDAADKLTGFAIEKRSAIERGRNTFNDVLK